MIERTLLIGVPCMSQVATEFYRSSVALRYPSNTRVMFSVTNSSMIYDARNLISQYAIENNFDRIMWLDSDMVFEPDIILRLNARLEEGYDIVSGLCFSRTEPYNPTCYKHLGFVDDENGRKRPVNDPYLDYPQNDIFEVKAVGMAACMMNTSVLRAIYEAKGPAFSPIIGFGEDLSFCIRAKEVGYKIYCDSSIKVGHVGHIVVTEEHFKGFVNGKTYVK